MQSGQRFPSDGKVKGLSGNHGVGGRERKGKHSLSRNKKLVENEDKLNSLKSHSKCLIDSLKY